MSDYRAIAGVSATLRTLLRDRMEDPVEVTLAPPDVTVAGAAGRRVNLYLYELLENGFLANQEIPGHGNGSAYGHPPLSLTLRYLMTGHGENETAADADLIGQQILGDAMRVLHDFSIVTPDLREQDDVTRPRILHASLLDAYERVKIRLEAPNLEEMSTLWSALPRASFRRSVSYQVSVIQIESRRPARLPQPVGPLPNAGPRVFAVPFARPRIQEVHVRYPGDAANSERRVAYARVGDTLILRGYGFVGEDIRVVIGNLALPATPLAGTRIEFGVPDDLLPGGIPIAEDARLQPGGQTVEVVVGVSALPAAGWSSNTGVFMLVPRVDALTPNLGVVPRRLTVAGARLFREGATGETIIGAAVIPSTAYQTASPTQLQLILPDSLPASPVQALVSGDLLAFPNLAGSLDFQVTLGAEGPHAAALATPPADLAEAAPALQSAIRAASSAPAFAGCQVAAIAADNRLVVIPGQLGAATAITLTGPAAGPLRLGGGTGEALRQVYLGGALRPFPVLSAMQPALLLTLGGVQHPATLPARPTGLAQAAAFLEAAIRTAGPEAGFADARVTTVDSQLLLLPGAAGAVAFDVTAEDETTTAELQLRAAYPVRVRVNGAESVEGPTLALPS